MSDFFERKMELKKALDDIIDVLIEEGVITMSSVEIDRYGGAGFGKMDEGVMYELSNGRTLKIVLYENF